MFQSAIANAMIGKVDTDTATNLVCIHDFVCRQMWCPKCGGIMDSRKTVMVEMPENSGITPRYLFMCGTCFDAIGDGLKEYDFKFTDSRLYKPNGTLKPKPRKTKPGKTGYLMVAGGKSGPMARAIEVRKTITIHGEKWIIHRPVRDTSDKWEITHTDTGVSGWRGKTQRECIEHIESKGYDEINKAVVRVMADTGPVLDLVKAGKLWEVGAK